MKFTVAYTGIYLFLSFALTACGGGGNGGTQPGGQASSLQISSSSMQASSAVSVSSSSKASSVASASSTSSPVTVTELYKLSPNNMPIGVAVPASGQNSVLTNLPRQELVLKHFSQFTAENIMKPESLHPAQNTYSFVSADALVKLAKDNGKTVHGHTLVWYMQLPGWMKSFSGTKTDWINLLEDHVTQIVTHFNEPGIQDTVTSWDVVNEAFEDQGSRYRGDNNGESIWYKNIGPEYIERAYIAAHAANPDVDLYYNDYNLEWNDTKLDAVVAMVKDFKARNIPINGVGFQMHLWSSSDISKLREQFQKVVAIDPTLKIKISEMDIRFNHVSPPLTAPTAEIYEKHKAIIHNIVSAYLEVVPAAQRGGITSWGILDGDSWILDLYGLPDWPLLFFNDTKPKPALQGFADALEGK